MGAVVEEPTSPDAKADISREAEGPTTEVLDQVRATLHRGRAKGALVPPPQALLPLDADEIEPLEFYPWRMVVGSKTELLLKDALETPADRFVRRCYRLLLLRDPDENEARLAAESPATGWTRLILIARLRGSAEGRRAGVRVVGLGLSLLPALVSSVFRKDP
jgi:O-antigen chain-terminating methyltransferase